MSEEIDYRYPGSRPFEDTRIDRCLFFGREKEKQSLLHMVLTEKLVVLFAKSGIGKTSLLNSGIMKQLRQKGYLPFRITFTDPKIEPLEAVYENIDEIVKEYHIDSKPGEKATLWQYFKTAQFWSPNDILFIPILILDQFEELFTLHSKKRREKFVTQLADLVRNRIPTTLLESIRSDEGFPYTDTPPAIKIVISVREDFLANLEEMSDEIPDILNKRFRLSPLGCGEARKAIEEPARVKSEQIKTATFQYTPDAIDSMIAFLSKKKERVRHGIFEEIKSTRNFLRKRKAKIRTVTTNEVEPFELQLLCHDIERKVHKRAAKEGGDIIIKKDDLGGQKGMQRVLEEFYSDQIKKLRSPFVRKRVRKLFEKHLISDTDRRRSLDEEEIELKAKVPEAILQKLVKNRLLRSEPRLDSVYYELSHDTLIDPIRKSQRRRKLKRRLVTAGLLIIILITFTFISLKPRPSDKANEYVLSALRCLEQEKFKEAHMQFVKAIEIDPNTVNIYNKFVSQFYNKKIYEEAIMVYDKAIKIRPNDGSLHYQRGIALEAKGSLEEAIDAYHKAIQLEPGLGKAYIQLGTVYKKLGNFDEAEKNLNVALNYDNKNIDVYKKLALLYIKQDQYDEVKDVYRKAIEADPELGHIYTYLVRALERKGQGVIADSIYEIASNVKSTDKDYYFDLGYYLNERGKYELAIRNYEKVLEIDHRYTYAYINLVVIYHEVKYEFTKAYDLMKKAHELRPGNSSIESNLAETSLSTERFEEAFALANKLAREENIPLYRRLAMKFVSSCSLLFLGKRSDALDGLRDLIKEYKGLDKYYWSDWNYGGIEHFIAETSKLSEADKKILLNVIKVLESPRQKTDEKLRELDASLSVIL